MKNKSLLLSFWGYIKRPDYSIALIEKSNWAKFKDILMFWSLGVVVAYFAALISSNLLSSGGFDDSQNVLNDFFSRNNIFLIVFLVFFFGPITEELIFRMALRFSPLRFGFFLALFLFVVFEISLEFFAPLSLYVEALIDSFGIFKFLTALGFLIFIFGLVFSFVIARTKLASSIEKVYTKYFRYIFYLSIVSFGFVHFFNFENFSELWLVVPLLVLPQVFLGAILGYIRMHYNLFWSIFYHFFHNTIVSLPLLFINNVSEESMDIFLNSENFDISKVPDHDLGYIFGALALTMLIVALVLSSFLALIHNHNKYKNS